ncbi:predicted protein [Naegleria gruberi]|uniref:Predicted protein n=1 Tax=Naegleria gruberi TaxID=5762 RepID=D2W534_NAEGR|nr:uncharacterized protein NAEGRDRAFT_76522 [Naegleria gruberi]EFC35818.1 predicted protein [Naegleria gruberi]|eukprot:XP_002668562.1 predicted protein [Naegleria gruberi strain NEG-M]
MLEVLSRKRIRNLENHSNVVQCLNELEIENATIKRVLPLMLEEDFEKRPTTNDLDDKTKIIIDKEVDDYYENPNKYKRYPNLNHLTPISEEDCKLVQASIGNLRNVKLQ